MVDVAGSRFGTEGPADGVGEVGIERGTERDRRRERRPAGGLESEWAVLEPERRDLEPLDRREIADAAAAVSVPVGVRAADEPQLFLGRECRHEVANPVAAFGFIPLCGAGFHHSLSVVSLPVSPRMFASFSRR